MIEETTHLDLCSGIGGFALALNDAARRTDRNVRTVAFCEPDKFCKQVLNKHWPEVPIYDDVKTFPRDFGKVNILTAGYPCTPFSQAGKRKGSADDRHIWPWVLEIVKQTRPDVAVFENVVGHISMGLDEVLLDLENEGYRAWPIILGAVSKNAPHRRQRVWIVAYNMADTNSRGRSSVLNKGSSNKKNKRGEKYTKQSSSVADVADTVSDTERATHRIDQGIGQQYGDEPDIGKRREVGSHPGDSGENVADFKSQGQTQGSAISGLGGTFDGLSAWVDGDWERGVPRVIEGQKDRAKRLMALGNSIVPQVASEIFTAIFQAEDV